MQPTTPSPKSFPVATSAKRANLEVILLPLLPLRLTLANNPLTQPLRLKALIQLRQVLDDQPASRHDSFLGCDRPVGLDAQFKRGEERVGHFVGGEHDGGVLEEPLREEVAERVVFFVEGEDGRVGDACLGFLFNFCWPSSSRKSSNLSGAFILPGLSPLYAYLLLSVCMNTPIAIASEEGARRL